MFQETPVMPFSPGFDSVQNPTPSPLEYSPPPTEEPEEIRVFPDPSPKFQEEAFEFFSAAGRLGRAYVKAKEPHFKLLDRLYLNDIGLKEWRDGFALRRAEAAGTSRESIIPDDTDDELWISDYVYPIGDLIDKWAASAIGQIFEGAEFLTVLNDEVPNSRGEGEAPPPAPIPPTNPAGQIPPENVMSTGLPAPPGDPAAMGLFDQEQPPSQFEMPVDAKRAIGWGMTEPTEAVAEYPLTTKMQAFLLHALSKGHIGSRLKLVLTDFAKFGSQFSKVLWKERVIPKWTHELDPGTGEWKTVRGEDLVYEAVIVRPIDLGQLIPDPQAESDDVQNEWRWIGHRTLKTFDSIVWGFGQGTYNLNEKEFKDQFGPRGESQETIILDDKIHEDEDKTIEPDPQGRVQLWEIHGEVPSESEGPTECMCIIATDLGSDDPSSGVLIKLTTHPVCYCGLRPFAACQFIQQAEPFGLGLIDRQEKSIYSLSQSIAQFEDGMRLTCQPAYTCPSQSPAWDLIKKDKGRLVPGRIYPLDEPGQEIKPLDVANFNPQVLMQDIQTKKGWLEAQTLSETFQGVAGKAEITATQAHLLQQQSARPTQSITMIFAKTFLEPMGEIALGWIQQMVLADRKVKVPGPTGQDVTTTITAEEIQNGKFRVVPTLTRNDATKMAKAQAFERMIPILINAEPHLMQEGSKVSLTEVTQRWIDQIGVDGADRIIQVIGTQEQMLRDEVQQLQMQLQQMSEAMAQMEKQIPTPTMAKQAPAGNGGPPLARGLGPMSPPPQFPKQGPMGEEPTDPNVMADIMKEIQRQAHQPYGENNQ